MLEKKEQYAVEIGGVQEQAAFTIKANAKMFRTLIMGLYSRKIEAIVRELSTNAYDAHKAAGCLDRPFYLKLPTYFDNSFAVRDYGISMSHDQIMGLYATLGGSTKDQDNFAVGKFGLGSKTPFAYTDNFTVTAIMNGEKRIYNAFIDEHGTPQIALFHRDVTDEENGIEISFPVDPKDILAFSSAAKKVMIGFDLLPDTNVALDVDLTTLFRGDNYRVINVGQGNDLNGCAFWIRQGCVLYPIELQSINQDDVEKANKLFNKYSYLKFIIDVPIGEVDITPSRESISYDKDTIVNIGNAIKNSVDSYIDSIVKDIANQPTQFAATQKCYFLKRDLQSYTFDLISKSFKWRGRSLEPYISFSSTFSKSCAKRDCVIKIVKGAPYKKTVTYSDFMGTICPTEIPFFIYYTGKQPKHLSSRIKAFIKNNNQKIVIFMPNFNPNSAGFKRLLAKFYDPNVVIDRLVDISLYENFEIPDFTPIMNKLSLFDTETGWFKRCPNLESVTQGDVVWLPFTNDGKALFCKNALNDVPFNARKNCVGFNSLSLVIKSIQRLLNRNITLVGVPVSMKKAAQLKFPEEWISFEDFIRDTVVPLLDFNCLENRIVDSDVEKFHPSYSDWRDFVKSANSLTLVKENSNISNLYDLISHFEDNFKNHELTSLELNHRNVINFIDQIYLSNFVIFPNFKEPRDRVIKSSTDTIKTLNNAVENLNKLYPTVRFVLELYKKSYVEHNKRSLSVKIVSDYIRLRDIELNLLDHQESLTVNEELYLPSKLETSNT